MLESILYNNIRFANHLVSKYVREGKPAYNTAFQYMSCLKSLICGIHYGRKEGPWVDLKWRGEISGTLKSKYAKICQLQGTPMIQQADPMDTEGLSEIGKYLIGKHISY
jgi:hypothetical protein